MVVSVSHPSPLKFSDFQCLCAGGEDRRAVLGRSAASQGTGKSPGSVCLFSQVSELRLCHYSLKMAKVFVSLSGIQNDVMIKVHHTVCNAVRDQVCVKKSRDVL